MIECPNCYAENRPAARFCAHCGYKFLVGELLDGQYTVTRMLKVGGMGAVYQVERGGHIYALKEMRSRHLSPAERQQAINRFWAEAVTLAKLNHPRIPQIHQPFVEGDRYYLVMDFIEGQDLTAVLTATPGGRLPEAQVIEWGIQVCDVLAYLHNQSFPIIFRDVKPANLMLTPGQGIMVIDFGIARLFNPAQRSGVSLVGTPGYAAPEQYQGQVDFRSDIYGLGATLHHLLTGVSPADTSQHLFNFAPVRQHDANLSPQTERVINKALAMKLEDRFQSAEEMKQALQRTSVVVPTPTRKVEPPPPVDVTPPAKIEPLHLLEELWEKVVPLAASIPKPARIGAIALLVLVVVGVGLYYALSLTETPLPQVTDGQLAFVSSREGNPDIYLLDEAGQAIRLTHHLAHDIDPAYSPNQVQLAFASNRDGNWEIYQVNTDGTDLARFTYNPADDLEPAWSPSGSYIAFTSDRDGKREVYLLGPDKTSRMTFTPGDGESWEPAWGGGPIILFTSTRHGKREIYHTTSSGEVKRLTYSPGQSESWAAHRATTGYITFVSNRDGKPEIYLLSKSGDVQRLSTTPTDRKSLEPVSSPTGRLVAFTSNRTGRREIYLLSQGSVRQLTFTPPPAGSWSPAW